VDTYIWIDDADALNAEFTARGVRIAREICDQLMVAAILTLRIVTDTAFVLVRTWKADIRFSRCPTSA